MTETRARTRRLHSTPHVRSPQSKPQRMISGIIAVTKVRRLWRHYRHPVSARGRRPSHIQAPMATGNSSKMSLAEECMHNSPHRTNQPAIGAHFGRKLARPHGAQAADDASRGPGSRQQARYSQGSSARPGCFADKKRSKVGHVAEPPPPQQCPLWTCRVLSHTSVARRTERHRTARDPCIKGWEYPQ